MSISDIGRCGTIYLVTLHIHRQVRTVGMRLPGCGATGKVNRYLVFSNKPASTNLNKVTTSLVNIATLSWPNKQKTNKGIWLKEKFWFQNEGKIVVPYKSAVSLFWKLRIRQFTSWWISTLKFPTLSITSFTRSLNIETINVISIQINGTKNVFQSNVTH